MNYFMNLQNLTKFHEFHESYKNPVNKKFEGNLCTICVKFAKPLKHKSQIFLSVFALTKIIFKLVTCNFFKVNISALTFKFTCSGNVPKKIQ